jgi:hypothetical protein
MGNTFFSAVIFGLRMLLFYSSLRAILGGVFGVEIQYFRSLVFEFHIGNAIFSVLSFRILECKRNIFGP